MVTRLQRSSLDYTIACLARGQRPESLSQLPDVVSGDAYSRAVQEVADAERARRRGDAPPLDGFFDRERVSRNCTEHARRIARARLALYLRLVRRVEAWERAGRFSFTHWSAFTRQHPDGDAVYCVEAARIGGDVVPLRRLSLHPATPWHPLWTMAPQHDPLIPPWQRHGLPRRKRQESLGREAPQEVTHG